ncbi:phosphatase PAP2 family protein [Aquabacter sp. L1I39]|uniref:phosphatase PAP2 family protein n=1 Tax=Aquabacter sp. L1I39 TaxID=2820278 RepID=UPI001ADCAB1E|nr:phosphatase PAP2 family protein [Aquabacter sp. L1I39]QTL05412.1 phosphatase PAP2 family protein [Aquabacter sp. L1I39]
MKARLQRAGLFLRQALAGLGAAMSYARARKVRAPAPRLTSGGMVETLAVTILAVSLIAASMILLDPLIPGLRLQLPHGLVRVFERITDLGLGSVVLWPVGIALLVVLGAMPELKDMNRRVAAALAARIGFVFTCVAGVGLFVLVLKYVLGRARPYMALHLPGPHAVLTFDWFKLQSSFSSFPSGHSTVVFATACALAALYPRARTALFAVAVLVAFSRVVLGSHYPSDVLAGGALAILFSSFLLKAFAARRLVFSVAADGGVRPMPGPSARRLARLVARDSLSQRSALEEARP